MPKPITKTTAKVSMTHSRVALTVKYVSGEILKISSTFNRDRVGYERPTSMPPLEKSILQTVMSKTEKCKDGENNGERMERLAKFFETTASVTQAARWL